jgi:crossover junction endodeoxyribonuclease RuvC
MTFIGIDPGLSGALVAIDADANVVDAIRAPRTLGSKGPMDHAAIASWLADVGPVAFVAYESPSIRPGESGRSALTIGTNWGVVLGMIIVRGWRHEIITPARWKRAMGLPTRTAAEKDERKADSIALCRSLLPDLDLTPGQVRSPHDGLAEAGLLAVYARRVSMGRKNTKPGLSPADEQALCALMEG